MAVLFCSCQKSGFLDDKTNALDDKAVFSDSVRTLGFLNRIYQDIGYSFALYRFNSAGGAGNTEMATDNAEGNTSPSVWSNAYVQGSIGPGNVLTGFAADKDFWETPYRNIRRVNLLLARLPEAPFKESTKARMAAEARFLRAFYYYNMIAAFGGVPLIGDNVFDINDLINIPRNNFDECITYLVSELDKAAQALSSVVYADIDYGRITAGACLALKSRVLLYAASPLFNGGLSDSPADKVKLVGYTSFDKNRWQLAADAAEAVMKTGTYSLHKDNVTRPGNGFYDVFLKRVNNEYILAWNRGPQREMETFYLPASRSGSLVAKPTQNLVEAFPMKDGKPIAESPLYDPKMPYANRDPRFDYSIIYNGLSYTSNSGPKTPVYTYMGTTAYPNTTSDAYVPTGTLTGYYSRKMLDENLATNTAGTTDRGWPLIRYAEMLLNYAEAINEAGFPDKAYASLKELRDRAGILPGSDNLYGLKANMNVDDMRTIIQNERRIELAFEDHRFNDIRRWMIASTVLTGFNKIIIITKIKDDEWKFEVGAAKRALQFRKAMYLLPIPLTEIQKMPLMKQNPDY
jgi:hypothetical protein